MSMLDTTLAAARDRKRLAEIAAIAARHGLDPLFTRLGLPGLLPGRAGFAGADAEDEEQSLPERLRHAIEALGPTFIKLGQILSTRADLLPPEWLEELEKLQSHVAPTPFEDIRAQVEAELGGPPEQVFARFDTTPLAAGSIAQVHRATLTSGEEVVVKLRRPGLRPVIEADLRLLSHLAGLLERQRPEIGRYRPREILHNLGVAMGEELDLANEGRNCEEIAGNLAGLRNIRIPRIHAQWTSEHVLVQEFVEGIVPTDRPGLAAAGLDGRVLAQRGAEAFLQMALVDGVFHADPHPGNLRALPGNVVGFIDFGMVGRLGTRRRDQMIDLLGAIVSGKSEAVSALLVEWSGGQPIDLARLDAACDVFVGRHGRPPLRLGAAITDFMALARENDLALPSDLALLFKALLSVDGVMKGLDPEFDAIAVAAPIVKAQMRARFGPEQLLQKGQALALDSRG